MVQRFRLYQNNPRFVRLIAWQSLDQQDKEQKDMMEMMLTRSRAVITHLQASGEVNPALDPMTVILLITSMVSGYFIKSLTCWVSEEEEARYLTGVVETVERLLQP